MVFTTAIYVFFHDDLTFPVTFGGKKHYSIPANQKKLNPPYREQIWI